MGQQLGQTVFAKKLEFHGFSRAGLGPSHPLVLQQKPRSILAKYDEELEGERPHSFRLEQGGMADGLRERELEEIRTKLRLQAQSLSSVGPRLASEYLSPEEMVSFSLLCDGTVLRLQVTSHRALVGGEVEC